VVRWSAATGIRFDEPDPVEPDDDYDYDDEVPRRRRGGRTLGFILVTLGLLFLAYAIMRVFAAETDPFTIAAVTITPYVVAAGVLLGLVTLLLGRRVVGLSVLAMALALGVLLVPRYLSDSQPEADGPRLRIMAANLWNGRADPSAVVDLVRSQQVDLLVLPELTPAALAALDDEGLGDLLPNRALDARVGGDGVGILAKFPLRKIVLMPESSLGQLSAVVDLPGRDDLEVVAVHILPPTTSASVPVWRNELAALPHPDTDERTRVLAGDFNATLDHAAFRELLDRGYVDAAEEAGEGLSPTWSTWPYGPPITIDHLLADGRSAIVSYAVFDLPGSDHNAILTELVLP
jgi:endonuclease/exonuclease/phosphatase (EEP) superfamily protein YafD